MRNISDKVIDEQGNACTFTSGQDARLVYQTVNGELKKYLIDGEGGGGCSDTPSASYLVNDFGTYVESTTNEGKTNSQVNINPVKPENGNTMRVNVNFDQTPGITIGSDNDIVSGVANMFVLVGVDNQTYFTVNNYINSVNFKFPNNFKEDDYATTQHLQLLTKTLTGGNGIERGINFKNLGARWYGAGPEEEGSEGEEFQDLVLALEAGDVIKSQETIIVGEEGEEEEITIRVLTKRIEVKGTGKDTFMEFSSMYCPDEPHRSGTRIRIGCYEEGVDEPRGITLVNDFDQPHIYIDGNVKINGQDPVLQ